MQLPKLILGNWVKFTHTACNPYNDNNERYLHIEKLPEPQRGIIVGVTQICEGERVEDIELGEFGPILSKCTSFIVKRRHKVYEIKQELRGPTYKVLPEHIEGIG